MFATFIRMDSIIDLGTSHGRKVCDQAKPYITPDEDFTQDEHLQADTAFIGDGEERVVPRKGDDFALRRRWNSAIRRVRTTNE